MEAHIDNEEVDDSRVNRRTLMKMGTAGAAVALVGGATAAPAQAVGGGGGIGGKRIILDVDTMGFANFEAPAGTPAAPGPFYVGGMILWPGTSKKIGDFHCWGHIPASGLGVISQEFDIGGRGKIQVAGVESDAPRAVTGGTGDFSQVRGEGFPDIVMFDFMNTGKFRIDFRLRSTRGKSIKP